MSNKTDGNYDGTRPWGGQGGSGSYNAAGIPQWTYLGPWASNMERLTQQALMVATMPADQIQRMVKPPLPQIRAFPDRYGYGPRTQPDIDDVVSVDRVYQDPRVSWYSGSPAGYSGSSRNDLGAN